ncbi:MAG: hypothetical protein M3N47_15000 [Chloroflexota bacterium]|nr:hypothetical protein [Chloroflexota bacterium]
MSLDWMSGSGGPRPDTIKPRGSDGGQPTGLRVFDGSHASCVDERRQQSAPLAAVR